MLGKSVRMLAISTGSRNILEAFHPAHEAQGTDM